MLKPNKIKIAAENGSGNYRFIMRNTLDEEKPNDRFEGGDREEIRPQCRSFAWTTL